MKYLNNQLDVIKLSKSLFARTLSKKYSSISLRNVYVNNLDNGLRTSNVNIVTFFHRFCRLKFYFKMGKILVGHIFQGTYWTRN